MSFLNTLEKKALCMCVEVSSSDRVSLNEQPRRPGLEVSAKRVNSEGYQLVKYVARLKSMASWGRREVDGVNHRGIKLQIDIKIGVI